MGERRWWARGISEVYLVRKRFLVSIGSRLHCTPSQLDGLLVGSISKYEVMNLVLHVGAHVRLGALGCRPWARAALSLTAGGGRACHPHERLFFSQGRFIRPHSSLPTTREWPVSCGKKTRSQIGPRQVPACCRPPSRRLYRVLQPCVLQARSKSVNAARTDLQPQASPAPSPAHAPRSNPPYSALLRNGAPPRR